jgi:hypothetical protein
MPVIPVTEEVEARSLSLTWAKRLQNSVSLHIKENRQAVNLSGKQRGTNIWVSMFQSYEEH